MVNFGCVLWDLSCSVVGNFCPAWRKSIRRIWNLPCQAHGYLLSLLCGCLPVYDEICLRSVNFVHSRILLIGALLSSLSHGTAFSPRDAAMLARSWES